MVSFILREFYPSKRDLVHIGYEVGWALKDRIKILPQTGK
jgi:hypothetical protein